MAGQPTRSADSCHRHYPLRGSQFSAQLYISNHKSDHDVRTHHVVLAERTGLAARRREAAEQKGIAEGFVRQRVFRKVLLRTSELAWLLSWRRGARLWLGLGWSVRGPVRGGSRYVTLGSRTRESATPPLDVGDWGIPSLICVSGWNLSTFDALLNCVIGAIPTAYESSISLNRSVSGAGDAKG